MLRSGVKTVVLYLEDWQKRMIKDFLGVDCNTYEVSLASGPSVVRYGIPVHEESKRMYFTGWQMREMRDEAGVVCEFIELHRDNIHVLYMAPTK